MNFVILRLLKHNELGVFHSYRRLGKEIGRQRAINFDGEIVDRVFPAAGDADTIALTLRYESDEGVQAKEQSLRRQHKNWRLEGNCPPDRCYDFVDPGCLFAMVVDAGTRPATGAWAVYPADHAVTLAITADAESSTLTGRSMIALHDSEGRRTLALLRESKPDLFAPEEAAEATQAAEVAPMQTNARGAGVHLPPDPKRLVAILGSVGHSLPSAVADIVDNAISKDATEIRIAFGRPDDGHGRWMTITDNGTGMDRPRLAEAMRIGSASEYESADLGKYGYGLKGASWSQTSSFTVVTKKAGKPLAHLTWDTAIMESWHAQDGPLEPWVEEISDVGEHGTCVFWQNMRPPKAMPAAKGTAPHTAELQELHRHLGLVFHRFLEGKAAGRRKLTMTIEGVRVEANDPVGHTGTSAYDRKTVRIPTGAADAFVQVQAYLLPSEAEVRALHGDDADAMRRSLDRIGMYGRRNESQGVYVYRNHRLIQWGGWHQMWSTSDEKTKLARVTVDFGTDLDDQFAVNISKRMVTLSQQLQEEIRKLAEIARNDSKRKYRDTGEPAEPKAGGRSRTGGGTTAGPSTAGPAVPPITGGTRPSTPATNGLPPQVPVRPVRTSSFIWKISRDMTGGREIQISDQEPGLHGLYLAVSKDPKALASLAAFLERLDGAGVQQALLAPKTGG